MSGNNPIGNLFISAFTVFLIICFIIAIPVSIIKGRVQNKTLNATYVSKTDRHVKIQFTKKEGNAPNGVNPFDNPHIVYLYADGEKYYGIYKFDLSDKFNKVIKVCFYDYGDGRLNEQFDYSKKKLTVSGTYHEGVFIDNPSFAKKTWWSTWGIKLLILAAVFFAVWSFKDAPKILKDKGLREEVKVDDTHES